MFSFKLNFLLLVAFLLSNTINADMFVNLLDMPSKGSTKGAAGMLISSAVEMERKGSYRVLDADRQSLVVSGMHGLSSNTGVFGGVAHITDGEWGDNLEGNTYFGGAYGEVDLIQGTKVLAYGQYKSFDEEFKSNLDVSGSEISVGLLGVYGLGSGTDFYIGPNYVFSSDIDVEKNSKDYEREKKFGIRVGFNHPMAGNNMSFYGTAGFMNEQSFFLGVSRDFN